MKFENIIKALGATFFTLLGGWSMGLKALLIFMAVDYATGLGKGFILGALSSQIGAKGIVKKVMYLCIVIVAVQIDLAAQEVGLTTGGAVHTWTIYFLMVNEGISILENASTCGAPVPKFLKTRLKQFKEQFDSYEIPKIIKGK